MKNSINAYLTTYSESKGIRTAIIVHLIGIIILFGICMA